MLLKDGSSFWVNHSVTSRGGAETLLPTRGSARSRNAWADAALVANNSSSEAGPIKDERFMFVTLGTGLQVERGRRIGACRSLWDRCRRDSSATARSPRYCCRSAG